MFLHFQRISILPASDLCMSTCAVSLRPQQSCQIAGQCCYLYWIDAGWERKLVTGHIGGEQVTEGAGIPGPSPQQHCSSLTSSWQKSIDWHALFSIPGPSPWQHSSVLTPESILLSTVYAAGFCYDFPTQLYWAMKKKPPLSRGGAQQRPGIAQGSVMTMKVNVFLPSVNINQPGHEILAVKWIAENNLNEPYSQYKMTQYGEFRFAE